MRAEAIRSYGVANLTKRAPGSEIARSDKDPMMLARPRSRH